jgi:subtilisin family serine protease
LHVALAALAALLAIPAAAAEWHNKIDPWVLEQFDPPGSDNATGEAAAAEAAEAEFLVFLAEQADLSAARRLPGKTAKGRFVFGRLTEVAARSQRPVLDELAARRLPHRSYWIANMIWVRGDLGAVQAMAERGDVARILANPWVAAELPAPEEEAALVPSAIEWGVDRVGAPDLWAEGVTGQGAVVAGQDTGYDWDHPALIGKYRGWNGATADHDYNWHDAIHVANSDCPADSTEPCDDNNHGTHTMGTMIGDDGGANQIGVAPSARWIGCRNMNDGNGTPATYSECFQWFLAPTEVGGANPDPAMAPDVINNSWACPPSEGCSPTALQTVVENTRAAGIVVVVSAGNSGTGCSTVADPPAIYDASFSVGSTTSSDLISGFSSRGPVTADGSNRPKPDVAAPGSSIRSSVRNGGYSTFNGTSMAGPHVAGLVALLLAAEPGLAGDVDQIEECLRQTAVPSWNTQTCGGIPSGDVPNNVFGHGRARLVWPLPPACASGELFSDGFETGDVSAWTAAAP